MKFRKYLACCLALALSLSLFAVFTTVKASAADVAAFTTTEEGVTVNTTSKGITTATGTAGSAMTLTYSEKVDFSEGASFRYVIPKISDTDVDYEARTSGKNYIVATVKNDSGYGVEFKIYALYSKTATTHLNKMQVDVTYLDPTITKIGGDYSTGRQYLETFTTYMNVEDSFHTIDVHKESGMWFFASDGMSALPVTAINKNLVLGDCTVTFTMYAAGVNPTVKIYPVEKGILKSYVINGFMQLGSDIVTENNDDTVKIKVADKIAAENPGALIRYREQLISTVGYDVRKPINIEYSYDVSNASAVWYALGLGRPDVLESISKVKYDVNKTNGEASDGYSDSLAAMNDGIMIQTTTGLAQPTYREQNSRLAPYKTNSKSKPYSGREDMDIVTFIVKEDGTDMYMNGQLIFDNLITKLSDFADNDYMAYPYFHFFEDKASTEKGNTIVIKGVNAARRTDEKALKVVGGSNKDLEVGLTDNDNGDITLWHYADGALTAVDSSLYTYDKANEKLTLKYAYFEGKDYEVYNLYARNNSGSEEISVRFSDPTLVTIPASTDKEVYPWIKGGTEDLVVTADIHNGTFVSFSGGGISSSQYVYAPKENSTVGTITISKAYLNGKKVGTYTYTIKTTNVEEEIFACTFKIEIKDDDADEPTDSGNTSSGGTSAGGNTSSGGTEKPSKGGCGGSIGGLSLFGLAGLAVVFIAKKKNK